MTFLGHPSKTSHSNGSSEFLCHEPCEQGGSSDAKSIYDDGHSYCFVCHHYTHGDGPGKKFPGGSLDGQLGKAFPGGCPWTPWTSKGPRVSSKGPWTSKGPRVTWRPLEGTRGQASKSTPKVLPPTPPSKKYSKSSPPDYPLGKSSQKVVPWDSRLETSFQTAVPKYSPTYCFYI